MANVMKSVDHMKIIGVNDEWETPLDIFQQGIKRTGIIPELDVCCTKQNTKCISYFTKEGNGLYLEWIRDWFCNPPYSEVDKWIERANNQSMKHKTNGFMLIFHKSDTKWYHKYIYNIETESYLHKIYPIKGRVNFLLNGNQVKNSSPYDSIFIEFRGR